MLGSKLAQGEASVLTLPLPANLAGSAILVAGREAPLVSASDGQLTAVIPYGIGANATQPVVIARGDSLSAPQPSNNVSQVTVSIGGVAAGGQVPVIVTAAGQSVRGA